MKKILGLLTALMMMFALSACGGDSGSGSVKVGEKSSTKLTEDNFFEVLTKAQTGAGSALMTMNMNALGQEMSITAEVNMGKTLKDTAMDMTMGMDGEEFQIIMVDGFMYLNMGELSGNKFIKIDSDDPDSPVAGDFDKMAEQMDPAAQLKTIEEATVSVKSLGDGGKLDGVKTTKWEVTVDPSKLDVDEEAAAAMPETITYLIWVGEDNLPRKQEFEVSGTKTETLFTKWGQDFNIKAPSSDQVTEGLDGLM